MTSAWWKTFGNAKCWNLKRWSFLQFQPRLPSRSGNAQIPGPDPHRDVKDLSLQVYCNFAVRPWPWGLDDFRLPGSSRSQDSLDSIKDYIMWVQYVRAIPACSIGPVHFQNPLYNSLIYLQWLLGDRSINNLCLEFPADILWFAEAAEVAEHSESQWLDSNIDISR